MPHSTASDDLREVEPHPVHGTDLPRFLSVCGCGWEIYPSAFRSFALADLHAHQVDAHDGPAPATTHGTLAACMAEAAQR